MLYQLVSYHMNILLIILSRTCIGLSPPGVPKQTKEANLFAGLAVRGIPKGSLCLLMEGAGQRSVVVFAKLRSPITRMSRNLPGHYTLPRHPTSKDPKQRGV